MNEEIKAIYDDKREIKALWDCGGNEYYEVGRRNVTKIIPCTENGEMALVTWFAVYCGACLKYRVNGKYVEVVVYQEPTDD